MVFVWLEILDFPYVFVEWNVSSQHSASEAAYVEGIMCRLWIPDPQHSFLLLCATPTPIPIVSFLHWSAVSFQRTSGRASPVQESECFIFVMHNCLYLYKWLWLTSRICLSNPVLNLVCMVRNSSGTLSLSLHPLLSLLLHPSGGRPVSLRKKK